MSKFAPRRRPSGRPAPVAARPAFRLEQLETRDTPATFTWTGLGADNRWATDLNWFGGRHPTGAPGEQADLVFPALAAGVPGGQLSPVNDIDNGVFNTITFGAANYQLSGNPLTLGIPGAPGANGLGSGSVLVNAGLRNETLNIDLTLGASAGSAQTFSVNAGSELTVTSRLSSPAGTTAATSSTLTKAGTGTLTLGNDDSGFLGTIRVLNDSGRLVIGNRFALGPVTNPDGSAGAPTTIGTNSTLGLQNVSGDIGERLLLNGPGSDNAGALNNLSGNTVWAGPIALDSNATIGAAAAVLIVRGQVSDNASVYNLTKEGPGEVRLNPAAGNTYRGTTVVNNGILTVGHPLALGAAGSAGNGTVVNSTLTGAGQLRLGPDASGFGFTVVGEALTLNGRGMQPMTNPGALQNVGVNHTWAGPVDLGSPNPNGSDVSIGVAARADGTATELTISGVVASPNGAFALTKVDVGRLVLSNANTYSGTTTVAAGVLTVRDSLALGQTAAGTTVANGAALELEVETGDPAATDAQGRVLGNDSVTGDRNRLLLSEPLSITGTGVGAAGALRNVAGINQYAAGVALTGGAAAIGVDADSRAGTPTADADYILNDFSLTVTGNIGGGAGTTFRKLGAGHLILPRANSYTGVTTVEAGWVTVENATALGARIPGLGDTVQPRTVVSAGAAVHVRKANAGDPDLTIAENITLAGAGPAHPYAFIGGQGALVNLGGANTWAGDVLLGGPTGIGTERVAPGQPSELTVTGSVAGAGGVVKFGSGRLTLQGDGSYTGATDIRAGTVRVQNDTALGRDSSGTARSAEAFPQTTTTLASGAVVEFAQGVARLNGGVSAGVQVWDERLVVGDPGQQIAVAGLGGTFTLAFRGQTTGPLPITATAAAVQTALNALPNLVGAAGPAAVTRAGHVFTVAFGTARSNSIELLTAATAGGAEAAVSGDSASVVVLSGDNAWRGPVALARGNRFDIRSDARLLLLGAVGDGGAPAAGADLVKRGAGELLLGGANTFRGTTAVDQGLLTAMNGSAFGTTDAGTVVADGAQLQLQGALTVAGESLTVQGTGPATAQNIPARWFSTGPAPTNNGAAPLNQPTAGRITGVAVDPSDAQVIYAATAGGGAWKTKDGGKTWKPLFDQFGQPLGSPGGAVLVGGSFAVAPTDPRVVYFATGESNSRDLFKGVFDSFAGSGVYKSTDSGDTWVLLADGGGANPVAGQAVSKVAVDDTDPNVVYAATGTRTGTVANAPTPTPTPGVWRYTGTPGAGGAWRNLVGAGSISTSRQAGGVPGQAPYDAPTNGSGPPGTPGPDDDYRIVFPQQNATWSDLVVVGGELYAALGEATEQPYIPPAAAPAPPLQQAVRRGLYHTLNPRSNTPSWRYGPDGTPVDQRPTGQAGFPLGDVTAAAGRNGYIKVAAGSPVLINFVPVQVVWAVVTDPANPNALLDLQFTLNGGQSWTAVANPPTLAGLFGPPGQEQGRYDIAIAFDRTTDPLAVPPVPFGTVYVAGRDRVFKSIDNGATWASLNPDGRAGGPARFFHALTVDRNRNVVSGSDGGVWRYDFAAGLFDDLNGTLSAAQVFAADPHPTDPSKALAGTRNNGTQVFNNGTAWDRVDDAAATETTAVRYDARNPATAYEVRSGQLRKTVDGGANWVLLSDGPVATAVPITTAVGLIVDPLVPSRVLIGGATLRESTTGGVRVDPTNAAEDPFVSLNAPRTTTAFAAATYQGPFVADPSFALVTDQLSNTYDPATLYGTDGQAVFLTKNRGVSWVFRTPPLAAGGTITDLAVDPSNRDVVYAAVSRPAGVAGGRVYRSTDAGRTWQDVTGAADPTPADPNTGPLPQIPTWRLAIDPRPERTTVYVGNDNGVWQLADAVTADPSTLTWSRVGAGMPQVAVRDIVVNQTLNTLTAGTYGRGVFQLFLANDYRPSSGSARAVSGSAVWTGTVFLNGATTVQTAGTQQLQNGIAPANLEVLGPIVDAPGLPAGTRPDLIKTGRGTLTLSAANSYTGRTLVTEGVLVVGNANALGSAAAAADTAVTAGAVLALRTNLDAEPVTVAGRGFLFNGHFTGALRNISNANTYTGTLTLATDATVGVDSGTSLTVGGTGTVTDGAASFTLDKELTGTLILASANTYDGLTRVAAGALQVQNGQALGSSAAGTLVADGAQLQVARNGAVDTSVPAEPLFLSGTGIGRTGALLGLAGNNTYAGPIDFVSAGPAAFNVFPPLPPPAPSTQVAIGAASPADTLTIDTVLDLAGTPETFGLLKVGAGTVILARASAYTGSTTVEAGTLRVRNAGSLGTGPAAAVSAGASLELDGGVTVAKPLTLNGDGVNGNGALRSFAGDNVYAGDVTLASDASVGANAGTTLTVTGIVQNLPAAANAPPRLRKADAGLVELTASNPYAGRTVVDNGVLRLTNPAALGGTAAEQQTVRVTGLNGTFALTFDGLTTSDLPFNATAAQVQAALEALSTVGVGNVSVAAAGSAGDITYTVTFANGLAGINQPQLVVARQGGAAQVTIATTVQGPEGTTVNPGGTLQLAGGGLFDRELLTIAGGGFQGQGALNNFSGNNSWDTPTTLAGNASVGTTNPGDLLTLSRTTTDGGNKYNVDIVGPGTVAYTAAGDNQYTGTTAVRAGTLLLAQPTGVAVRGVLVVGGGAAAATVREGPLAADQVADTSAVTVAGNGLFDLNGRTDAVGVVTVNDLVGAVSTKAGVVQTGTGGQLTVAALALSDGAVDIGSGGRVVLNGNVTAASTAVGAAVISGTFAGGAAAQGVLDLNGLDRTVNVADGPAADDLRVSALLGSTGPAAKLLKDGAGRLTFSPGATTPVTVTVRNGDVQVTTALGPVELNGANAASLSGTGTVAGIRGVTGPSNPAGAAIGTVSPGTAGNPAGILNVVTSRAVQWDARTTFRVNLSGATQPPVAGTDYDQLNVSGSVVLGGAVLDGVPAAGAANQVRNGNRFTILRATGGVTGRFAEPNGTGVAVIAGQKFTVTYNATDVVLEKVKADVTVSVVSSANPATVNQPVTFTATVTPEAGTTLTATTVTFIIDGVAVVPDVAVVNGVAAYTTTGLSAGSHGVSVRYNGDADTFNTATATLAANQVVEQPAIGNLSGGPAFISPANGSGTNSPNQDAFAATATVTGERAPTVYTVTVVDGGGSTVRTFSPTVTGLTANSFRLDVQFDGSTGVDLDANGKLDPLPDGAYTLTASFLDQYGNAPLSPPAGVTVTVDNTSPVVGGVTLRPGRLTPGAAVRVLDAAITDTNLTGWAVNIRNAGGAVVRTFTGTTTTVAVDWDGRGPGGAVLPDGVYSFEVVADDAAGNETTQPVPGTVLVLAVSPTLDPVVGGPAYISPTLDTPAGTPVQNAFSLSATARDETAPSATWTVTIRNAGGTVVRTDTRAAVIDPVAKTATLAYDWNGRTGPAANAPAVPEGVYTLTVSLADPFLASFGLTLDAAPVSVTVDNTAPTAGAVATTAGFIAPGTSGAVPATADLTAAVADANLDQWTLTVRSPGGAAVRTFTGNTPAVAATFDGRDGSGVVLPDGTYRVELSVRDKAGSSATGTATTVVVRTNPPAVTLTSNAASVVYGQAFTLTAAVDAGDVSDRLPGDTVEFSRGGSVIGSGTIALVNGSYQTTVTVPPLAAGTYADLTATYLGSSVFLPGTSAAATVTVTPAPLTARAGSQTKVYGAAVSGLTFAVDGLVNGDSRSAVVTGSPATTATAGSGVGAYPITRGSVAANGNYALAFADGTLTVTPAPLRITPNDVNRVIGTANPPLTAGYQGLVNGDTPAVVSGLALTTTATVDSRVGTYPIAAGGTPTAPNYTVTVGGGTLSVVPAATDTVVGSGAGTASGAKVYRPDGSPRATANPFPGFRGGIRTATADFNRDGVPDTVLGTGPGTTARLVILDGQSQAELFSATPFDDFDKGLFVAVGDVDGDGQADLVVTPDEGGGPRVVVYRGGDFDPILSYFGIDDPDFRGGARAAVGDINNDGFADVAVSAGFGGGPRVSIWDGKGLSQGSYNTLTSDFFVFDTNLRNGTYASIGDVDADGYGDLVVGAGPGGGPRVVVLSGRRLLQNGPAAAVASPTANFFAGNPANRGGVRVAAKYLDGDLNADVVTGPGDGGGSTATAYRGSDLAAGSAEALYDLPGFNDLNGVYVG